MSPSTSAVSSATSNSFPSHSNESKRYDSSHDINPDLDVHPKVEMSIPCESVDHLSPLIIVSETITRSANFPTNVSTETIDEAAYGTVTDEKNSANLVNACIGDCKDESTVRNVQTNTSPCEVKESTSFGYDIGETSQNLDSTMIAIDEPQPSKIASAENDPHMTNNLKKSDDSYESKNISAIQLHSDENIRNKATTEKLQYAENPIDIEFNNSSLHDEESVNATSHNLSGLKNVKIEMDDSENNEIDDHAFVKTIDFLDGNKSSNDEETVFLMQPPDNELLGKVTVLVRSSPKETVADVEIQTSTSQDDTNLRSNDPTQTSTIGSHCDQHKQVVTSEGDCEILSEKAVQKDPQIQERRGILRQSMFRRPRSASVENLTESMKDGDQFATATRRMRSYSELPNGQNIGNGKVGDSYVRFASANPDRPSQRSRSYSKESINSHRSNISESRFPFKKRKASHDLSFQMSVQSQKQKKDTNDLSVSFENVEVVNHRDSSEILGCLDDKFRLRSDSTTSMTFDLVFSNRKYSIDTSNSTILPGLGEPSDYKLEFAGDFDIHGTDNQKNQLGSFSIGKVDLSGCSSFDDRKNSIDNANEMGIKDDKSAGSDTIASSGQRLLLQTLLFQNGSETEGDATASATGNFAAQNVHHSNKDSVSMRRDRFESWGGMSDISAPIGSDSALMANLLGSWHHPGSAHESPVGEDALYLEVKTDDDVGKFFMAGRDRLNSLASMPESWSALEQDHCETEASIGDEFIQDCVVAAMTSIQDDIADLATAVEYAASSTESVFGDNFDKDFSFQEDDSHPDLAITDLDTTGNQSRRPRSWSASSGRISVDYGAVQAAVDAAEAASVSLGLKPSTDPECVTEQKKASKQRNLKRKLPMKISLPTVISTVPEPSSQSEDANVMVEVAVDIITSTSTPAPSVIKELDAPKKGKRNPHLPPIKKRVKRNSIGPEPTQVPSSNLDSSHVATPLISNKGLAATPRESNDTIPIIPLSNCSLDSKKDAKQQGQSNQKWESMFECLVEFVNERRIEETSHYSENEKDEWIWDGNVPTTYKSTDGKALGRWVNNQRSAKSKGSLKNDRETRLVSIGLKWSVLASNSWNLMLEELTLYINEQKQKGLEWDGNVPTNYQIKTKLDSYFAGEDKNLGRWVNRQRSMFQAGKLRKDRQLDLERIGLKWSMLATTSWDTMYETLVKYVEEQSKIAAVWDGNVPANYRTEDNPPRSLGRWINRQRSAFIKRKLKQEYVDKLNVLGLKWSVHHRHGENDDENSQDSDSDSENKDGEVISNKTDISDVAKPLSPVQSRTEVRQAIETSTDDVANTNTNDILPKDGKTIGEAIEKLPASNTQSLSHLEVPKEDVKQEVASV